MPSLRSSRAKKAAEGEKKPSKSQAASFCNEKESDFQSQKDVKRRKSRCPAPTIDDLKVVDDVIASKKTKKDSDISASTSKSSTTKKRSAAVGQQSTKKSSTLSKSIESNTSKKGKKNRTVVINGDIENSDPVEELGGNVKGGNEDAGCSSKHSVSSKYFGNNRRSASSSSSSSSSDEDEEWEDVLDEGEIMGNSDLSSIPSTSKLLPVHEKEETEPNVDDDDEFDIIKTTLNNNNGDQKVIQITLDPQKRPKTKKQLDKEALFKKEIRKFRKGFLESIHKEVTETGLSSKEVESVKKPVASPGKKKKSNLGKPGGSMKGDESKLPDQAYYWTEVYLESEERWICIGWKDDRSLDKPEWIETECLQMTLLHSRSSHPLIYAFAVDDHGGIRDVTTRYCGGWLTSSTKGRRIDSAWLRECLKSFVISSNRLRDRAEDMELHQALMKQPIPTTISDCKSHPLYVLKRDLKRCEALYPPDTKPIGMIRGEPVYHRDKLHTLHDKTSWLKEARVIRVGEEPYKNVKARKRPPKKGEILMDTDDTKQLDLYGYWQTEAYISPPAVDGKIPRNEYGNVDMFKPSMLPPGTVHLHVPGLLAVAKKLDIDCAPAMVGWEYCGRGSFPLFDGWIVCEENVETLLAAWDHDEAHREERAKKKRSDRALANWRKLIRGCMIRVSLQDKYSQPSTLAQLTESTIPSFSSQPLLDEEPTDAEKEETRQETNLAWPQNKRHFLIDDTE